MSRELTPRTSLENLKREAKRWLRALRENDPDARARLVRATAGVAANPGLRDVQHALARELGFESWRALKLEVERRATTVPDSPREAAVQALLAAADRGDAARVSEVLATHPDIVNESATLPGNTGKRTALHFAVNSESEAVVGLLLAHGADPNIRDEGDNAMPLHFAAERGAFGLVKVLIEHGADPIGAGDYHELEVIGWATCFGRASERDRHELVDYILAHGARHNIFSAVATGAIEPMSSIVERSRAQLDRPMDTANQHRRPLHLAVVQRQPESLAALLALGADPGARDAAGLTPLDEAALRGERAMAQRLIEHGARLHLPAAVALERKDDIDRLLRDEPDTLRPGGRWDKLIIRASERSDARVIETLIHCGASVHVRDDHRTAVDGTHGFTPLHAAAFRGNADAARVLLRHGANPADREDRYWGTPAGWAAHAGHIGLRDMILDAPGIDIFDAIRYDRLERLDPILVQDPGAVDRKFGEYVNGERTARPWLDPAWTPAAFAVAEGKPAALSILIDHGADLAARDSAGRTLLDVATAAGHEEIAALLNASAPGTTPGTTPDATPRARSRDTLEARAADFLRMACLDWRVDGSERVARSHDAGRILARNLEIARANIYTAVACGELDVARRILDERPEAVSEIGGPRSWPPLLYLCSARLPQAKSSENAVAIARLLLDRGADPNAFYLGGNADIHYTAFTCVMGRGEDQEAVHPRARELVKLLLERGADPHDNQVLYNVFADNTSRHLLDDDIIWLLELMYEHSIRRGHRGKWEDPTWPMFDMRGAPSLGHEDRLHHGARFMLDAAVDRNLLGMAGWLLAHGAGPNTPPGTLWKGSTRTLYQEAVARGFTEMAELLVRYGATPEPPELAGYDAFVAASLAMDRSRARSLLEQHPHYKADPRALFTAIRRDRVDIVEMLLGLGVSPDVRHPHSGATPLHAAASAGAEHSAALLIARGANVDVRDRSYDATPLGWASYFQQARMIELLGGYSRDIWQLVYTGQTERLRAILREEPALARVASHDGSTPLMWLPGDPVRALEIASLLVEHGADPSRRDGQRQSAADIATSRGLDTVAALLLESGGGEPGPGAPV